MQYIGYILYKYIHIYVIHFLQIWISLLLKKKFHHFQRFNLFAFWYSTSKQMLYLLTINIYHKLGKMCMKRKRERERETERRKSRNLNISLYICIVYTRRKPELSVETFATRVCPWNLPHQGALLNARGDR